MLSVNFKVLDIGACSTTFKVCSFPDYNIVIANCYHDLKFELMSTIFRKLYWKIHSFLSIVSCGVLMVCSLVSAWMLECSSGTHSHWFFFFFFPFWWFQVSLLFVWSGVAYSKHILQVFSYSGGHKVWLKLEVIL